MRRPFVRVCLLAALLVVSPGLGPVGSRAARPWLGAALAAQSVAPGVPPEPQAFPAGFAQGAYRTGGRVRAPVPLREVQPTYPEAAAASGATGVIEVLVVVRPDGTVGAARALTFIQRGPGMETAAVAAARRYLFSPGRKDGVAVPVVATIFVSFDLPGVPRDGPLAMGGTGDPPSSVPAALGAGAERPGPDVLRPLPIKKVYPLRASQSRATGKATRVEFIVRLGADGQVSDLQLLPGSGGPDATEAERAIRQWTFEPAIKAGKAVPLVMTAFIEF